MTVQARPTFANESTAAAGKPPLLRLAGLTKRFGTLTACDAIDLELRAGEILALLGENGAGKSTLMKTVFGVHPPDGGQVLIDGAPVAFASPRAAMAARIGMVFQTFSLIPALTVRENLALAWPGTPWLLGRRGRNLAGALERLAQLAPDIDPGSRLGDLSVAEQQLVELAKVLNLDARLVILDEPTAVLTPQEAQGLHTRLRQLARDGVAVVLITHKLADVEAVADRVAVMRRGRLVSEAAAGSLDRQALVVAMVGESAESAPSPPPRPVQPVPRLQLRRLSAQAPQGRIAGIDLEIGGGEIVGVAGVSGNGQSVLSEAVAGVIPISAGDVVLDGTSIARFAGDRPRALALGYVPEEPRRNAVAPSLSLQSNLMLRALSPRGAAGREALRSEVPERLRAFDVRPPEPQRKAGTLSGGNLQKLVLARETGQPQPAILLTFPTMGLDVTATAAVYRRMTAAAEAGAAILWISEELDDLLSLAHRIAVIREGQLVAVLANDGKLTRERLGTLMTGDDR